MGGLAIFLIDFCNLLDRSFVQFQIDAIFTQKCQFQTILKKKKKNQNFANLLKIKKVHAQIVLQYKTPGIQSQV